MDTQKTNIEELPIAERLKLAESLNYFAQISPGCYIDAKDETDKWCMCNVLKINANEISVNFDGWSSRYDEVLFIYINLSFINYRLLS